MKENVIWLFLITAGFLSGSIMFSKWLPHYICSRDICSESDDGNPGATNVFASCGVLIGTICLILDMAKGAVPVIAAQLLCDTDDLLFALVMTAPVLGHAVAPFDHFTGGKCIAASFGILAALLAKTRIGLLLAGIYIFFSTVRKISPVCRRSIFTFSLFGAAAFTVMFFTGKHSIAIGCLLLYLP